MSVPVAERTIWHLDKPLWSKPKAVSEEWMKSEPEGWRLDAEAFTLNVSAADQNTEEPAVLQAYVKQQGDGD